MTCTTQDAINYLNGRRIMVALDRALPFPVQYICEKLDDKLPKEIAAYQKRCVATCEELCTKDADGKPITGESGYTFTPEADAALRETLAPLLAETLVIQNVRKFSPAEVGTTVALTKPELAALKPFLDDAA